MTWQQRPALRQCLWLAALYLVESMWTANSEAKRYFLTSHKCSKNPRQISGLLPFSCSKLPIFFFLLLPFFTIALIVFFCSSSVVILSQGQQQSRGSSCDSSSCEQLSLHSATKGIKELQNRHCLDPACLNEDRLLQGRSLSYLASNTSFWSWFAWQ